MSTGRLVQFRLGMRLARRELRRHAARAVLVVVMVAVPTAAMTAVSTLLRTSEWSGADQARALAGRADARGFPSKALDGFEPNQPLTTALLDGLRAALPAGSSVLAERTLYDRIRLGDRRAYPSLSDLRLDDPMVVGRFGRLRGRLPATGGETVVTDALARELGVGIGDTVTPDRLGRPLTVVGVVRARAASNVVAYVTGPLSSHPQLATTVWIDHPPGPAPSVPGWDVSAEDTRNAITIPEGVFWSYVGGGVGLLVLGTVVTAAFAIGARRQLRTIGLLSSSGAAPGVVAWFLVAQGAVAGLVGSVAGVAVGLIVTRLTPDRLIESFAGHPIDGPVTRLVDLLPIVLIGTGAAMVAAWLPARSAARVPTLQALAGRRPLPRVPARLPILGATSVGAGCALFAVAVAGARSRGSSLWPLVAVAGAVAVLVGALAVAPWVVSGLERASGRWSQSWRLAARSLTRSRVRSSAVVGAICAVAATAVGVSTLNASFSGRDPCCTGGLPSVRDNQVLLSTHTVAAPEVGAVFVPSSVPAPVPATVTARLASIVPGARFVGIDHLVPEGQSGVGGVAHVQFAVPVGGDGAVLVSSGVALASAELVDLFGVPRALREALDRGGAISVVGDPAAAGATLTFGGQRPDEPGAPRRPISLALNGSFDSPAATTALPRVLIGPAGVERLGLVARPSGQSLVRLAGPATDVQRAALRRLAGDLAWEDNELPNPEGRLSVSLLTPPNGGGVSEGVVKAGLLGLSLALVLAVVVVGLALAATDSQDERQVLAAVGAPPRILRQVGTRRAALLVLCASLIAVPAGLLPAAAIVAAAGGNGLLPDDPFRVDPWALGFLIVGLPLAVAGAAAAAARLRDGLRPRRPATFATFE